MKQQEEQFCSEQPQEYVEIKQLFPANPIYQKILKQETKPNFKVQIIKNELLNKEALRPIFKKQKSEDQQQIDYTQCYKSPISNHYQNQKMFYQKYNNKEYNKLNYIEYYSSKFIESQLLKANKEQLKNLKQLHNHVLNQQPLSEYDLSYKNQIRFDSNFESGNLFTAYRKNQYQFDLILQNDINSKGNTQWFYFSVTNLQKDVQYTFNIINLMKSDSLFNYGMQPCVYSEQRYRRLGEGWHRSGKNISYTKNNIRREKSRRFYYTLTFTISTKFAGDILYIAHCFPYTYTMLNDYLTNLIKNQQKKINITRNTIGKTIANNTIDCLTICQQIDRKKDNRKVILIFARQHPGQSQGSYVCQGMINFFISKAKQAEFLRKNFIIKIIPMINPDGVIFGNYRTNLMGFDLNRKWDVYDKQGLFTEVSCIKSLIIQIQKQRKIRFIIDLHGHSKKLNSFFYGNPCPQNPENVKAFPYMCSKLNSQITFDDCTFTIEEQKKKAARVYLSLTHNIINVYTFETSFYGYVKENKKYSFTIQQYKLLGGTLCQGLHYFLQYEYFNEIKSGQKLNGVYLRYLNEIKANPELLNHGGSNHSASESNPQQCEVTSIQKQLLDKRQKSQKNQNIEKAIEINLASSSKSKNEKASKDSYKNARKLKYLQINRVNGIIPDKYQLGLVPTIKFNQYQKEYQFDSRFQKKSLTNFKISQFTQTEPISQETFDDFKMLNNQFNFSQKFTRPPSFRFKDNYDLKYVSLTTTKYKNNMILKLDFANKPSQPMNVMDKIKNTFSQTLLSSCNRYDKKKSTTVFPTVQNLDSKQLDSKMKFQIYKIAKLQKTKQQNQDFLNEMIKRYWREAKQKSQGQTKPLLITDQRFSYEKSLPSKMDQKKTMRPLSIKKKQFTKKGSILAVTPKK